VASIVEKIGGNVVDLRVDWLGNPPKSPFSKGGLSKAPPFCKGGLGGILEGLRIMS
jgi:hypothetical protein